VSGDQDDRRRSDGAQAIALARGILELVEQRSLPPVRVGLDTGPAVEHDGDWFGSTVNAASRVAGAARAGELLVTERTLAACAGTGAQLSERGPRALEGLPALTLYGQALMSR
jgi:adenylate cyclase